MWIHNFMTNFILLSIVENNKYIHKYLGLLNDVPIMYNEKHKFYKGTR